MRFSGLVCRRLPDVPAHVTWHAEATFIIEHGGTVVFEEPDLLVGELADGLRRWLDHGATTAGPFEFTSIEFDEPGVVYLRPDSGDRWRVGSVLDGAGEITVPGREVVDAVREFCDELGIEVENRFGLDLYSGGEPPPAGRGGRDPDDRRGRPTDDRAPKGVGPPR